MALRLKKNVLSKHHSDRQSRKEYTILLVDDEKENLDSLSLVLDREYNLLFANDGQEALKLIENKEYPDDIHMIISDQRMPKLTGVGLFQKTSELLPDAIRIILTGFTDADAIISSINEGQIYKFLTKPIDPMDLRVTVRRSLEYYSLEQRNVQLVIDLKQRVDEVESLVKAFEKFVPRQFLDRVATEGVKNLDDLVIGKAQSGTVSVLFSDIRSFTTLSETMPPQDVLNLINACFRRLSGAVHDNSGFVDKYIGDAIMALFDSTDDSQKTQAANAVRAALGMQKALAVYNLERREDGYQPIQIGVGVHTGPVIIGTVGVETRMDLTVLGDSVNIAARLESLNKIYDSSIIVSAHTRRLLLDYDEFQWRELDCMRVKGRGEPLIVYEVFDAKDEEAGARGHLLDQYHSALEHYYAARWDTAKQAFEQYLEKDPGDRVSSLYIERCLNADDTQLDGLLQYRKTMNKN
jgi:adenylate cyclase